MFCFSITGTTITLTRKGIPHPDTTQGIRMCFLGAGTGHANPSRPGALWACNYTRRAMVWHPEYYIVVKTGKW